MQYEKNPDGYSGSHADADNGTGRACGILLQGLAIQGKTAQENETRTRELLTDWLTGLNLLK